MSSAGIFAPPFRSGRNETLVRAALTSSRLRIFLFAAVAFVCALEGWYGQPELFGDDISYLDIVNRIRVSDWKAALNPLWSVGYPMLLSVVRLAFPDTVAGELRAVFLLNLGIALAGYVAFLCLVKEILCFQRANRTGPLSPLSSVAATFAYLTAAIGCARVSSIGPDLLLAALFFVATTLLLRLLSKPTHSLAAAFGVTLGLGYLAKAFFLPLAAILLLVLLIVWFRKRRFRLLMTVALSWLVFVIPYAAGLSWAYGKWTLGESAALNYEFHVNHLPHWMGWEGDGVGYTPAGDPPHGTPIHPLQLLHTDPPVFAFGEPFHVTYPPQFNMPYWYEGYHHFTRMPNVFRAMLANLRSTIGVIAHNAGFVLALIACVSIPYRSPRHLFSRSRSLLVTAPWLVAPILAILLYQQVHLEPRYIAGFVAIIALLPIVLIELDPTVLKPRVIAMMILLLGIGGTTDLLVQLRGPIYDAFHRRPLQTEGQWRIAHFLTAAGLQPGEKVASVDYRNELRCAWAYGARVRIVAAIGNDAFDPYWQDQLRDMHSFFENPAVQREVINLFRRQGAIAVVAPDVPFPVSAAGWKAVPGTTAWILLLR